MSPRDWVYHPSPLEVSERAKALLPTLWNIGEGAYVIEVHGAREVKFIAEKHGTKRGITAYVRRDTVDTKPPPGRKGLARKPYSSLWLWLPFLGLSVVLPIVGIVMRGR